MDYSDECFLKLLNELKSFIQGMKIFEKLDSLNCNRFDSRLDFREENFIQYMTNCENEINSFIELLTINECGLESIHNAGVELHTKLEFFFEAYSNMMNSINFPEIKEIIPFFNEFFKTEKYFNRVSSEVYIKFYFLNYLFYEYSFWSEIGQEILFLFSEIYFIQNDIRLGYNRFDWFCEKSNRQIQSQIAGKENMLNIIKEYFSINAPEYKEIYESRMLQKNIEQKIVQLKTIEKQGSGSIVGGFVRKEDERIKHLKRIKYWSLPKKDYLQTEKYLLNELHKILKINNVCIHIIDSNIYIFKKEISPDFTISEDGKNKLSEKYEQWENEQQEYDDSYDDYSNDGCGEGYSCNECTNFGCNAHPNNY